MQRRWWTEIDWPGACAFVLACGLSIGFCVALIWAASPSTPDLSQEAAALLSTLGGAMVGAVATYLGLSRREHQRKDDDNGGAS